MKLTLNSIWSFYTAKDGSAFDAAAAALKERFSQLAQRQSAREAVMAEYPALLRAFTIRQGGVLGKRLG